MKKLSVIFVTMFLMFAFCQIQAQDIKNYASNMGKKGKRIEIRTEHKEMRKLAENNVSDFSLKSFNTDFGNKSSNVSWTRTDKYDEATFMKDGHETRAYYDLEGLLVGTTILKTYADLPQRARNTIAKRYPDYTVESSLIYNFNKLSDAQMFMFSDQFVDSQNFFVQLSNGAEKIVLQVTPVGQVFFFSKIK
jgi:hypothetical protein